MTCGVHVLCAQAKREQWVEAKTQEIKDITVRGLESEVGQDSELLPLVPTATPTLLRGLGHGHQIPRS